MNGKDLEKNLYQDRNHTSVVFVDEEKEALEVRGILDNKFSIEPIASSHRSEDNLAAHRLFHLDDIDNPLSNDSVQDLNLSAQDVGLSSPEVTERKLKNLPEEFVVEVRIFSAPSHGINKTMDDLIQYFSLIMSKVNQFYKQLSKPKVQFIVVGITKLTNDSFARLVPDPAHNRTLIDLCGTVGSFYKYVKATLAQDAQDAVVYVSSLPGGGNVGCSNTCGVCSGNTVTAQSLNFRQPGNWESYVIAHELGHLLGMAHEGECPPYHTPGNERLRCRKQEFGYVLGSGRPPHYFSRCLQDQTRGCLMTRTEKCFELTGAKKIF